MVKANEVVIDLEKGRVCALVAKLKLYTSWCCI